MSDFREYDKHDIYFAYPENWTLEQSDMGTASGMVQLTNDSGAFWLMKIHPFGTNPEEIAREALSAMQDEYLDMEFERIDMEMFEKSITGFEIHFFYLDLMNLARVLAFEEDGLTYAVFWQTGNQLIIHNDETVPVEKVLEAITFSFLRGKISC